MRLMLAIALALVAPAAARTYDLPATPQTVAWGHNDATSKPALTIRSGNTVVHTLLTNSPNGWEKAGVAPADVEPAGRVELSRLLRPGASSPCLVNQCA